jgi:hypothetical protein
MKKIILTFVVAFTFCTTAMASDIAISTQAGWMGQGTADTQAQIIVDNVENVSIDVFTSSQLDDLATWVQDHTGNGTADLLIMFGIFPSTIYPAGNAQPDGSIAEAFLDDGNVIINTGDYIFYVGSAGNNDAGGLANMTNVSGAAMWGDDSGATTFAPTDDGRLYTPSLPTLPSNRPFFPAQFDGTDWEVELVLAQNSDGSQVMPAILHNTVTDGRVGAFFQWSDDSQPRGQVISEWVNNWFLQLIASGNPYARRPDPIDGSYYSDTWVTLSWERGDFAASHDVYMGDNFDDVSNATRDSEVYRGNLDLDTNYYFAGFPGGAFPDGLINGQTYYWRIDEVNDADPNSPWKGKIWSFSIPPKKAYDPVPGDGSKFIDSANVVLKWTTGFAAKLHTVYFGDDYDTVANATGGTSQGTLSFNPGALEPDKTYYWRVDEDDILTIHTGDVWSFTTAKEGGGVKAQYYNGMNFENLVLTRIDPQINFNWGDPGSPDASVNVDQFSARWTGEVEAAFTETYTFYTSSDDGARLWVNGVQLVDSWIDQGTTEHSGKIDLVAGNTYSFVMEYYENGGGAVAQLRWSSPSTPKQLIPQAALSPPVRASAPSPASGATGTKLTPILTWSPGDYAVSHDVYFGTDADAVKNADMSSPEYKGSKVLGDESYDPGKLAWFTTYYWRVDEVNDISPDNPWVGNVWSFTTGDFILIDDFEEYNSGENQIWFFWKDGLGYGSPDSADYYAGNGTGAAVGDETTNSYTEETIVHGGRQSMPLSYDNNKQGYSKYSETELTLTDTRDWTDENVAELSIWFRGYPASTGSFVESPAGTYTMTASGADIWAVNGVEADEFHFAYKMLSGAGSIIARVDSVQNTNEWAKAGVMIRESLEPDSAHAFACMTPDYGVAMQYRPSTGGTSVNFNQTGVAAPYWVKLERSISGLFTVSQSANGTSWQPVTGSTPQTIPMVANVYIGLALTAHDATQTCQAVFSNVTFTGNVTGQWADQDIGIPSNDPEPLYVAVSNSNGTSAIVVHDDPAAAQISTWTEWIIPLSAFADQGINLTDVDSIALGLGTRGNTTVAGGSGKMFFDDIRLYRERSAPQP